jgi:hypothetical protein
MKWITESRLLELCGLSRAQLNSWIKSGLDLEKAGARAAYGLYELVKILLLAKLRAHLSPKQMIGVWAELAKGGRDAEIVAAARALKPGERFDLVVDLRFSTFDVALSEKELLNAVRHPTDPRPVLVLDVADSVRLVVAAFHREANATRPPAARGPGRPRSAARNVVPMRGGER